ncbi:MAG: type II toxin-antitoxin system VapC family toxin [Pyrinomonadaceae bacterium]
MDIKSLPTSSRCLVDSNIFIYHLADMSDECSKLIERVARYEVEASITTTIIAEILHRRMIAEAVSRGLLSSGQTLKKLKASPTVIVSLSHYTLEVEKLLRLPLNVIEVTNADVSASHALRRTYGLLVNDSINLACAMNRGITGIVTRDSDFNRVPVITVWEPGDV